MPSEAVVDLIFTSLATGIIGSLLWVRLNRLEAGQADIKAEIKIDLAEIREQMARRSDLDQLREEMAVMRSDLTHVALAIGANRPQPMEG
jgi:hypothetical protein